MIYFPTIRYIGGNSRIVRTSFNFLSQFLSYKAENVKPVSLAHLLKSKIKFTGPLTVADYMKEVLTNPSLGYYMNRDVFGKEGDFVTSPEVSQLFGEMIAIWFINEWQRLGSPHPLQLIELGAGRGTMMEDILRVFSRYKQDKQLSCHLVEISPELSHLQAKRLCHKFEKNEDNTKPFYMTGVTKYNIPISWYYTLQDVPRRFTCLVAHEFFDALPIHKLQKTEYGWAEVLIDFDPNDEDGNTFRYIISKSPTPASKLYLEENESRNHVEVSPASFLIMQQIAQRLEEDGGIALIADYGHDGSKTDTFRAFRQHALHNPLKDPGTADLTADVDFSYLRKAVSNKLVTFGPVSQRDFLTQLQIDVRLQMLLKKCSESEAANIKSGYHMIMDKEKMGECFKFMAFYPDVLKDFLTTHPPVGFFS